MELFRGVFADHATGVEHNIPVGQIGDPCEPMLGDHDGDAVAFEPLDHVAQPFHGLRVQIARRLVEHEHPRVEHRGRHDRQLLLLTAGTVDNVAVVQMFDVERTQPFANATADLAGLHACVLAGEREFVSRVRMEILCFRILEHRPHFGRIVLHRRHAGVESTHAGLTVQTPPEILGREPVKQSGHRGLATPAAPDEHHDLARTCLQRHMVDRMHSAFHTVSGFIRRIPERATIQRTSSPVHTPP